MTIKVNQLSGSNFSHSKKQCDQCFNYYCIKRYLISKCGVSEDQVLNHEDEHFNYWNHFNINVSTMHKEDDNQS